MDKPTLYVHVADDGGILAVDSLTGRSRWVRLPELQEMLAQLREAGVLFWSAASEAP